MRGVGYFFWRDLELTYGDGDETEANEADEDCEDDENNEVNQDRIRISSEPKETGGSGRQWRLTQTAGRNINLILEPKWLRWLSAAHTPSGGGGGADAGHCL